MAEFKIGDIVLLKSDTSAPPMTITIIDTDPLLHPIVCEWRDNKGIPYSKRYPEEALVKYTPPSPIYMK